MVPHKSRKYRVILDLPFMLKNIRMEVPPVNEKKITTAPQHSMNQLGQMLPRLVRSVVRVPEKNGNIMFSKLDINDGYWCMVVQKGHHLNFSYVLSDKKGTRQASDTLDATDRMVRISPVFCATTKTARNIAEEMVHDPMGSLPIHPLEHLILPPEKWLEENMAITCKTYMHMMEVFVDDFCTMVQTSGIHTLRHISRSLLHTIHSVPPSPNISGHAGGFIFRTKNYPKERANGTCRKKILGWVFDGARRCIELPTKKINEIINEIKLIFCTLSIPYKCFERLVGKLRHAAIGLPAG